MDFDCFFIQMFFISKKAEWNKQCCFPSFYFSPYFIFSIGLPHEIDEDESCNNWPDINELLLLRPLTGFIWQIQNEKGPRRKFSFSYLRKEKFSGSNFDHFSQEKVHYISINEIEMIADTRKNKGISSDPIQTFSDKLKHFIPFFPFWVGALKSQWKSNLNLCSWLTKINFRDCFVVNSLKRSKKPCCNDWNANWNADFVPPLHSRRKL